MSCRRTRDNITDKGHKEVLLIYFYITKVEQGQGKNFVPGVLSFNC